MNHKFRISEYDRPNHPWKCGGEVEGLPCPLGPSRLGVCRSQCNPIQDGDRYFCANSSELAGDCDSGPHPDGTCGHFPHRCNPRKKGRDWVCTLGACADGPLPDGRCSRTLTCAPVRTLANKRRIVVLTTLAVAIGLLLIATSRPAGRVGDPSAVLLSSGPLSAHHQAAAKCDQCHDAGQGNLVDWVHLSLGAEQSVSQSEKCLECHVEIGHQDENALLAHGLDPSDLAARAPAQDTASSAVPFLLRVARLQKPDAKRKLACATCHDEHRGRDFDITQISDRQCQVCHTQAFHSFASGHPEFSSYPHDRRSATYFDHATHYRVHFANHARTSPDGISPTSNVKPAQPVDAASCNTCHLPDEHGRNMLIQPFDVACASCHGQQVSESRVRVINVPSSDDPASVALFVKRLDNGFMRILLSDEKTAQAREVLRTYTPQPTDIGDPDHSDPTHEGADASTEQPTTALSEAAQQYLNALAKVVKEFAAGDRTNLARRLQQAGVTADRSQQLAALLSVDDKSVREQLACDTPSVIDQPAWGIQVEPDHWTLSYRASHGDSNRDTRLMFLKSWLEFSGAKSSAESLAAHATGEAVEPFQQLFAELSAPSDSGRCLKCHTAESSGDGLRMHWSQSIRSEFTEFEHASHLPPRNRDYDCSGCHALDPALMAGDRLEFFRAAFFNNHGTVNTDASATCTSGFAPLTKAKCDTCHRQESGNDSCLTCHNYHFRH